MTKSRQAYPTDLQDNEWNVIAPYLPAARATGRPREHAWRELLNAIFYVVRSGCAWRMRPHDRPPWNTVYTYFRRWRLDGTWARLQCALREAVRAQRGRQAQPSAAILDSQRIKTAEGGPARG
jgi:putative transposase